MRPELWAAGREVENPKLLCSPEACFVFFFLFPRAAEATWWLAYAWEHILLLGMLKIHATIFPFHIPKYINVLVL